SLAIPRVLGWREDTRKLRPLTRQVFWTYAGYIWTTNVCFGLLSLLAPRALLEPTLLARSVSGFIAAYWGARLAIQLGWFDRSAAPRRTIFRLAEAALVSLFGYLTLVYGAVAVGAAR